MDYAYLPGTIDHPVAHTLGATSPSIVRYHEIDELGNVMGTSQSGAVSQTNSYDTWGNCDLRWKHRPAPRLEGTVLE